MTEHGRPEKPKKRAKRKFSCLLEHLQKQISNLPGNNYHDFRIKSSFYQILGYTWKTGIPVFTGKMSSMEIS